MCFVALKDINDLKYRETMGKRENLKKSYIYIYFFLVRLFTVLYFSVRSSRSRALCYWLPSCMSVKTT